MSAYLVSPETIAALATFLHRDGANEDRAWIAETLTTENIRSLQYRYPDTKGKVVKSFFPDLNKAQFLEAASQEHVGQLDPMTVLRLTHGYIYQSEHPGWKTSRARELIDWAIHGACSRLPGWNEAPRDL